MELTAAATLDALLAERDVDADEVVEDFKTARSATSHSNHELLGRCFAHTRNCQGRPAYSLLYGKEIIMTSLIAALKALLEALKSVRTMPFEWFAYLAAMLTIAACWNHLHPNEIIAAVAHIMRWESVAVWFTSGIPEFLIVGISEAGKFLILIVACLICAMSVQPARRVRKEGFEIEFDRCSRCWLRMDSAPGCHAAGAGRLGDTAAVCGFYCGYRVYLYLAGFLCFSIYYYGAWSS